MQRPQTSISVSQSKFERFYRGIKNESGEFYVTSGINRPGTPGQNVLARPPSSLIALNQTSTANSRLSTISSSSSGALNIGFTLPGQMNINVMERPITQHGIAGIRPGTGRGLSMTRQIQDKRYYIGLMQLKVRELNQEITVIIKDIEDQNKERATYLHYDKRAKDLATELTALQGQLADYNIVVDKMTSDIGKEIIEQETQELVTKNEQNSLKIENMFEERKKLTQQLNKIEKHLQDEKKRTERLIESMDTSTKEKYDELVKEKTSIQKKANDMQQELDELHKEQLYLEEEIALSPLKQEAVKLHFKIIEAEEKRDKMRKEEEYRISPEQEKEKLLQKIKQDNMDIAAAEAQLAEKKKKIQETEQKLEELETDMEDTQSEKQIKYKELKNREEIIEQFMVSFEQNKEDETKKMHKLEDTVVKFLKNISNMLNTDINFTGNNEMAILNNLPPFNGHEYVNNDKSFDTLAKENLKLQQVLSEMEMLEHKLKAEFTDLNSKMSDKENGLVILGDLNNLKTKLTLKQGQLIAECEELKQQQLKYEQEYKIIQSEYNEIKQRLENDVIYSQINILENTMEELMEEHKKVENFIFKEKERGNYAPIKKDTFNSINNYNSMLKENLKTTY
ncbi:Intraflagellar transport protein 74 like protein [Habropoda laboriosa]|uniref:Intraflagellar transport protein 74 like protein n=1 Tax=Habropoda laboriosa TaxID=597456 RepID=A0A0L7QZZ5_9HYME|nr:PREDICTED: intraflagellar transport protein 74 homolog [Habropoda laboriosa]KOC64137.1 Intraflagellar transport protein 74 like protein [Habropoda laboriosa]